MKKRSTEILQRLLKNPDENLSIQKLTDEYHISEKTLKSDIQEIMEFTRESGAKSMISFDNHALCLNNKQNIRPLMDMIYSMDPYHYKMSLEERKFYIIIVLIYHKSYYSMQQLADELFVTRNTIVNDCKVVDEYLSGYQIPFVAKSKKGIRIEADEEKIRNLLVDMFQSLLPSVKNEKTFFVQFLMQKTGFIYSLADTIYHMNCFTRENNIIFAKEVFYEIALCLFVLINRMQQIECGQKETLECRESLQLDTIGDMVGYVAGELGYSSLNRNGIVAIERVILLRKLHPQIQSLNDFELYGVICHFLLEMSHEIDIEIQSDDLLIESLISHVKSMNNWNDGEADWAVKYESFGEFTRIRAVADNKFYILENYLQYKLSPRMKDSIIIHICAALLRNRKNISPSNVLISCPGSMATSKYLEAQIKNYFNFHVADTMTTKEVEEAGGRFENIDFIISTVPVHDSALPVIVVSPLLTVEDINRIQSLVFKQNKKVVTDTREKYPILSKIYAIYESGDRRKIAYLDRELEEILNDAFYIESKILEQSALLRLLKLKYIKITDQRLEWKQAMEEAAEDLIKDGYFDTSYVNEAIENVEEYGNYIIVNKGIALAHARKEAGVYEDGISLLVAREGIRFEEGEVVNLLFFFSQKGDTDYLDLFKEIIKLGKNQEDIEKMKCLTGSMEVYQLISEILAEA